MALQAPLAARKKTLMVKLEAVKGVAETSGLLPLLAFDMKVKPSADWSPRPGAGTAVGHTVGGSLGARTGTATFDAELRCGEGATLEPALAALMQACGAAKTSEVYAQDILCAALNTVTILENIDGTLRGLAGAAGTVTFSGQVGEKLMLRFEFTGRWISVTDAALPTFTPATTAPMRIEGGVFTLGGEAIKIAEYTLNWGSQPARRPAAEGPGGVGHYAVMHFDPELTLDPEFDRVAGYDFYGLWLAGTTAAVVLAATAGARTATLTCPAVQIKELEDSDRDDIATLDYKGVPINDGATPAVTLAIT